MKGWSVERKLFVGIYAASLSIYLFALRTRLGADPGLHKEDLHDVFRNALCLEHGIQAHPSATNFSEALVFWLSSFLLYFSSLAQSYVKVALISFLPPVLYLVLKRVRPGISTIACLFSLALFVLSPSLSWFAVASSLTGLESLFGFITLLACMRVALRPEMAGFLPLVGLALLTAFSVHLYPTSLALLIPAVTIVAVHLYRPHISKSLPSSPQWTKYVTALWRPISFVGSTITLSLWPYLFFVTRPLVVLVGGAGSTLEGGILGRIFSPQGYEGLLVYLTDFFLQSKNYSYLLFDDLINPAFPLSRGGLLLVFLSFIGAVSAFRSWRVLAIVAGAAINIGILAVTINHYPGLRRAYPLSCCMVLLAGLGCDTVLRMSTDRPLGRLLRSASAALLLISLYEPALFWGVALSKRGDSDMAMQSEKQFKSEYGLKPARTSMLDDRTNLTYPWDHDLQEVGSWGRIDLGAGDRTPKHVTFIYLGQTRADLLTPYRPELATSPFLSRLAADSILYERAYNSSLNQSSAVVPLLCGFYPNIYNFPPGPQKDTKLPRTCLPQLLEADGLYPFYVKTSPSWFAPHFDYLAIMGVRDSMGGEHVEKLLHDDEKGRYRNFGNQYFDDFALVTLAREALTGPHDRRFTIYQTTSTDLRENQPQIQGYDVTKDRQLLDADGSIKGLEQYLHALRYQDAALERLFEVFRSNESFNDTLFVIVGNGGWNFQEGGLGDYGSDRSILERNIRAPLMLYWPGVTKGQRVHEPVSQLDLLPTVMQIMNPSSEPTVPPGVSLLTPAKSGRKIRTSCSSPYTCSAMVQDDKKYVEPVTGEPGSLYDLAADPSEKTPLSGADVSAVHQELRDWSKAVRAAYDDGIVGQVRDLVYESSKPESLPDVASFGDYVTLVGYDVPARVVKPDTHLKVALFLRAEKEVPTGFELKFFTSTKDPAQNNHKRLNPTFLTNAYLDYQPERWTPGTVVRIVADVTIPDDLDGIEPMELQLFAEQPGRGTYPIKAPHLRIVDGRLRLGVVYIIPRLPLRGGLLAFLLLTAIAAGASQLASGGARKSMLPGLFTLFLLAPVDTFHETYEDVRLNLKVWLLLYWTNLPDMTYWETVDSLLSQMQRENVEIDLGKISPDYLTMLELICKRQHLQCLPPKVRRFNEWSLDKCLTNIQYVD